MAIEISLIHVFFGGFEEFVENVQVRHEGQSGKSVSRGINLSSAIHFASYCGMPRQIAETL